MKSAITLIGPRSVGKSTIGRELAKRLAFEYLESDELMSKEMSDIGGLSVALKTKQIELIMKRSVDMIKRIMSLHNIVFDLAGGSISSPFNEINEINTHTIKDNSNVFALLPFEDDNKSISLLFEREKLRKHFLNSDMDELKIKVEKDFFEIKKTIMKNNFIIIYTGDRTPGEITEEITGRYLKIEQ